MRALRGRHSGLCQPNYVLDIPGGHGKSPIGPNYLRRRRAARPPATGSRTSTAVSHVYPPADLSWTGSRLPK